MVTRRDLALLVSRILALLLFTAAADFLFGILPSAMAELLNPGNLGGDTYFIVAMRNTVAFTLIYPAFAIAGGALLLRFGKALQRFLLPDSTGNSKPETEN